MRKRLDRRRTRFGGFVARFTIPRLVQELNARGCGVTRKAVYNWLAGQQPRPETAHALVVASGGEITLDDVYRHRYEVRDADGAAGRGAGTRGAGAGVAGGAQGRDRR